MEFKVQQHDHAVSTIMAHCTEKGLSGFGPSGPLLQDHDGTAHCE
jgi:hypothetical protein